MGVGDWRRLPIDRRGRGGPQRAQSLERNARSGKPESPAACGISGGFHPIYFLPLRSQGPLLPLRLPGVRRALSSETDEEPHFGGLQAAPAMPRPGRRLRLRRPVGR